MLVEGAFAASLDADQRRRGGQVLRLGRRRDRRAARCRRCRALRAAYDVTAAGNWEGHTILNRLDALGLARRGDRSRGSPRRARLLAARAGAHPPGPRRQGAGRLERPDDRRPGQCASALRPSRTGSRRRDAFDFRADPMSQGRASAPLRIAPAKPRRRPRRWDYANMIRACLALAGVTGNRDHIEQACAWTEVLDAHYWAALAGYYCRPRHRRSHHPPVQRSRRRGAERQRGDGDEFGSALTVDGRVALRQARRGDLQSVRAPASPRTRWRTRGCWAPRSMGWRHSSSC